MTDELRMRFALIVKSMGISDENLEKPWTDALLEAVCAEEDHKWPYLPDGIALNGVPLWKISGPCKRCGGRIENNLASGC